MSVHDQLRVLLFGLEIISLEATFKVIEELEFGGEPREFVSKWLRRSSYRACCVVPRTPCRACNIQDACNHAVLFPPLATGYNSPLALNVNAQKSLPQDSAFKVGITLIGEAVKALPLALHAASRLNTRYCELERVTSRTPSGDSVIYDGDLVDLDCVFMLADLLNDPITDDSIRLRFLSPPILEDRIEFSISPNQIPFPVFIGGITRRLNGLLNGDHPMFELNTDGVERSNPAADDELEFHHVSDFIELIMIGEWIQIGKWVERGLGKYEIRR